MCESLIHISSLTLPDPRQLARWSQWYTEWERTQGSCCWASVLKTTWPWPICRSMFILAIKSNNKRRFSITKPNQKADSFSFHFATSHLKLNLLQWVLWHQLRDALQLSFKGRITVFAYSLSAKEFNSCSFHPLARYTNVYHSFDSWIWKYFQRVLWPYAVISWYPQRLGSDTQTQTPKSIIQKGTVFAANLCNLPVHWNHL